MAMLNRRTWRGSGAVGMLDNVHVQDISGSSKRLKQDSHLIKTGTENLKEDSRKDFKLSFD
jgi:hypothetical protein